MSMYYSRSVNRYEITKEAFNYLLPIYGRCARVAKSCGAVLEGGFINEYLGRYFFCGADVEYKEMLQRCEYMN